MHCKLFALTKTHLAPDTRHDYGQWIQDIYTSRYNTQHFPGPKQWLAQGFLNALPDKTDIKKLEAYIFHFVCQDISTQPFFDKTIRLMQTIALDYAAYPKLQELCAQQLSTLKHPPIVIPELSQLFTIIATAADNYAVAANEIAKLWIKISTILSTENLQQNYKKTMHTNNPEKQLLLLKQTQQLESCKASLQVFMITQLAEFQLKAGKPQAAYETLMNIFGNSVPGNNTENTIPFFQIINNAPTDDMEARKQYLSLLLQSSETLIDTIQTLDDTATDNQKHFVTLPLGWLLGTTFIHLFPAEIIHDIFSGASHCVMTEAYREILYKPQPALHQEHIRQIKKLCAFYDTHNNVATTIADCVSGLLLFKQRKSFDPYRFIERIVALGLAAYTPDRLGLIVNKAIRNDHDINRITKEKKLASKRKDFLRFLVMRSYVYTLHSEHITNTPMY